MYGAHDGPLLSRCGRLPRVVDPSGVSTPDELGELLRDLRRRQAQRARTSPLTAAELAARTGWPVAAVSAYLAGRALPPAERLDALVRLLGATPAEVSALGLAWRNVAAPHKAPARADALAEARAGLPPDVAFAGRAGTIARLDALLPGVRALVVAGAAGVGKTALAVHYGHRVGGRFPDGAIGLDLRG